MTIALVVLAVLVVLLLAANVGTLRALHGGDDAPTEEQDPVVATALARSERTGAPANRTRRVITVEVLNPIELAAARGRIVGVAGSLAPGFVTRLVHEQTVKTLRRELTAQGVVAEVRLHTLAPPSPGVVDQVDRQVAVVDLTEPDESA